jgi:hypothetical protein
MSRGRRPIGNVGLQRGDLVLSIDGKPKARI